MKEADHHLVNIAGDGKNQRKPFLVMEQDGAIPFRRRAAPFEPAFAALLITIRIFRYLLGLSS